MFLQIFNWKFISNPILTGKMREYVGSGEDVPVNTVRGLRNWRGNMYWWLQVGGTYCPYNLKDRELYLRYARARTNAFTLCCWGYLVNTARFGAHFSIESEVLVAGEVKEGHHISRDQNRVLNRGVQEHMSLNIWERSAVVKSNDLQCAHVLLPPIFGKFLHPCKSYQGRQKWGCWGCYSTSRFCYSSI